MKNRKKIKIPQLAIRAEVAAGSYKQEENTVEVIWSVGAKGKRYTWDGAYYEELSMKKSDVDLTRLNNKAPVLKQHQAYSLDSNIGVVERAWIENGQGVAVLRLSKKESAREIVGDIISGIITKLSVGYSIDEYKDVSKKGDEIPTYRAVKWTPYEISFVNIPFDDAATVRSLENEEVIKGAYTVDVTRDAEDNEADASNNDETQESTDESSNEENNVDKNQKTNDNVEDDDKNQDSNKNIIEEKRTMTPEEIEAMKKQERESERTRAIEIRNACKAAGISDSSFQEKLITDGASIDECRKLILDKFVEDKQKNEPETKSHTVEVGTANRDKRIELASNALLHKTSEGKVKLSDDARQYRGMNLVRLAEEMLTAQGENVRGLSPNEIAGRALQTTSDFVHVLADVSNKSLRAGYDEQPQTFKPFVRETTVDDFKQISRTSLSAAPALEKVNEHGEYKTGKLVDSAEKYAVETFGKIVGVTRKVLINDDLDAFSRLPQMFGRAARDLETMLVYKEIASNPIMSDGNALFSAAHGNLAAAGSLISVASVGAGRLAMRLQKGLNSELIRIRPEFLLGPAALETEIEKFLGEIKPERDADVNPLKSLRGVTDAELDAYSSMAWYLIASKTQVDLIELARLSGQTGPTMENQIGFEIDGVKFKCSYDFGVKVIDWRGFYKNPGAAPAP